MVLCQNLPFLAFEIAFSAASEIGFTTITLTAVLFGLISIIISLFQCIISATTSPVKKSCMAKISIDCKSASVSSLSKSQFRMQFVNRRQVLENEFAKVLSIEANVTSIPVQILCPKQTIAGLDIIFHIQCCNEAQLAEIPKIINEIKQNGALLKVCQPHQFVWLNFNFFVSLVPSMQSETDLILKFIFFFFCDCTCFLG